MKITRKQLQRVIKEEVQRYLSEGGYSYGARDGGSSEDLLKIIDKIQRDLPDYYKSYEPFYRESTRKELVKTHPEYEKMSDAEFDAAFDEARESDFAPEGVDDEYMRDNEAALEVFIHEMNKEAPTYSSNLGLRGSQQYLDSKIKSALRKKGISLQEGEFEKLYSAALHMKYNKHGFDRAKAEEL